MTIKDAIILFLVVLVAVTIANLIALKVAATQVQGSFQNTSLFGMFTGAFKGSTPSTTSS